MDDFRRCGGRAEIFRSPLGPETYSAIRSFSPGPVPDLALVEVGSQLFGGGNGYGQLDCWVAAG
jgi:hypothetical protein